MLFNFDLQKNKKTQIIHDPIRLTISFSGTGEVFTKSNAPIMMLAEIEEPRGGGEREIQILRD